MHDISAKQTEINNDPMKLQIHDIKRSEDKANMAISTVQKLSQFDNSSTDPKTSNTNSNHTSNEVPALNINVPF